MTRPMKGRHRAYLALAAAALLGACGDMSTAPQANSAGMKPLTIVLGKENVGTGTFTIDPSKRITVIMGDHRLTLPAGSVCEPLTSGYGEGTWDNACTPSALPIAVTASWEVVDGNAKLSFTPDLRFVPTSSTSANDWVVLQLKNATDLLAGNHYQIYWRNSAGEWVDEAVEDSTLRAWTNRSENKVARRLKHFSGYVIGTAFTGEQSAQNPDTGTEVIAF